MKRTARLEQIEQILLDHPDGMRVVDISERCDVDRRTIYRDLETMQKMGIPIWQTNGRFGIEREQYFTHLRINLNEAFTVLWALRLLAHHTDIENPHAESLSQKIIDALPQKLAKQVEMAFSVRNPQTRSRQEMRILEALIRCWADNLKIMIWYKSQHTSKPTRRVIAPYILDTTAQGGLYVIGLDDYSREFRIFNVQRITRTEVLSDEPFRRMTSFDPRQHIYAAQEITNRNYSQTVVLRFQPDAAAQLTDHDPSQRIERYEDGSCIFIAEVMDWHQMETWVRSWGAQVEVIAPADFRSTIAAEFKQAAKLYG